MEESVHSDYEYAVKISRELTNDFGLNFGGQSHRDEDFYLDLIAPNFNVRLSKDRGFMTIDLASHFDRDTWVPLSFLKILFTTRKNFQNEIIPLPDLVAFLRENFERILIWFDPDLYWKNKVELLEMIRNEYQRP